MSRHRDFIDDEPLIDKILMPIVNVVGFVFIVPFAMAWAWWMNRNVTPSGPPTYDEWEQMAKDYRGT